MQQLAGSKSAITGYFEVLRNKHKIGSQLAYVRFIISQHAGLERLPPAEHRRPRRIAQRRSAVRIGEQHAALRESVDVRRLHLQMPAETTDPIIQIINGDEQNAGLVERSRVGGIQRSQRHQHERSVEGGDYKGRGSEHRLSPVDEQPNGRLLTVYSNARILMTRMLRQISFVCYYK